MSETPLTPEFTIEDRNASGTDSADSTDLACQECGVPLVYSGTGRKPKYCDEHKNGRNRSGGSGGSASSTAGNRGSGRGSSSVEQAVATLGNLYDLVGIGMFLASPEAAAVWSSGVDDLQTRNRAILTGDPDLTKSINRLGTRGGKWAFAAVQVSAITPPTIIAARSLRERQAARVAEQRRAKMREQNTSGPTDSGPAMGNAGFFG